MEERIEKGKDTKFISAILISTILGAAIAFGLSYLTFNTQIQNVQRELSNTNTLITAIQNNLTTLSSTVDGIVNTVTNLQDDLSKTQSDVTTLSSAIDEITTREWHTVKRFNGTDDETTTTFFVEGDMWRITWAAECIHTSVALFVIFVYPEGETSTVIAFDGAFPNDFDLIDTQFGIDYIAGKGRYYIKILATNLEYWSIKVESYH